MPPSQHFERPSPAEQTAPAACLPAPAAAGQGVGTRQFGGGLFDFIFVLFIFFAMAAVLVYCTAGLWGEAA